MNTATVLDKSLRITIHLRDQSSKQLAEDVCNGSGDNVDLKALSQSLVSLQTKVNTFLTELVDQERVTTQPANETNNTQQSDEDGTSLC